MTSSTRRFASWSGHSWYRSGSSNSATPHAWLRTGWRIAWRPHLRRLWLQQLRCPRALASLLGGDVVARGRRGRSPASGSRAEGGAGCVADDSSQGRGPGRGPGGAPQGGGAGTSRVDCRASFPARGGKASIGGGCGATPPAGAAAAAAVSITPWRRWPSTPP